MPLEILHLDITVVPCDVIVNPTDIYYSGSGGTDLAIHRAAGEELESACAALAPIDSGEVAVTEGYNLPCRYIIHTVGPIWQGGGHDEGVILRSCYLNSLLKAKSLGATSIAFPLISSGTFGFPKDKVLRIAMEAISDFLNSSDSEMLVCICILNRHAFELSKSIALQEYLAGYTPPSDIRFSLEPPEPMPEGFFEEECYFDNEIAPPEECDSELKMAPLASRKDSISAAPNLSEWISQRDDSFALMLFKLIDAKGMEDVECYKKANVTKNTFWKIRNSATYKPSKPTVIAFAIALELSLEETEALLKSAGFALSHNNLFDMIIEFYIRNGIYDIYEINAALYQYDQVCLGC